MSPLEKLEQADFGAGSQLEVAPHLISPTGFNNCENGLLNDDGTVYKRGGSSPYSSTSFGVGKFVWEGEMSVGRRTVVSNGEDFGVTATDEPGTTFINIFGQGFPTVPGSAVFFQHLLWLDGGWAYGGSRKPAGYNTGSITVTQGSGIVTGAGTAWGANVDPGTILTLGTPGRIYVVAQVNSDTEIELFEAYEGATASAQAYQLRQTVELGAPYLRRAHYAVAGERLIAMEGHRIDFSEPNKPHLYQATIFPQETVVQNFHELSEGVSILAGKTIGIDKLLVFHTGGITAYSNMAKSIVDGLGNSQHRIDIYSRDVVLWGSGAGIANSRATFIVPAIDNVYLVDGVSAPVPLGDAIIPRYRERLLEGMTPGGAFVIREHLVLPILDPAGAPVDLLVCRLDKPYTYRNKTLYPWSFQAGSGAALAYGTVRSPLVAGELPRGIAMAADGMLVDVLSWFTPGEANASDHDGTTHLFTFLTRDVGLGDEAIHRWRRLQLFYELWPVAGSTPTISAELGTGVREAGLPLWDEVEWDEFEWAGPDDGEFELLEGQAPANAGVAGQLAQNEYVWMTNARARYVRYRFSSADPVAKLVLLGFMAFPAETGGIRHSRTT